MPSATEIIDELLPFLPDEQCCQKKRDKAAKRGKLIWQLERYRTSKQIDYGAIPFVDTNKLKQLLMQQKEPLKKGNYKCIKAFKSHHGKMWKLGEIAGSKWIESLNDEEKKNMVWLNDASEVPAKGPSLINFDSPAENNFAVPEQPKEESDAEKRQRHIQAQVEALQKKKQEEAVIPVVLQPDIEDEPQKPTTTYSGTFGSFSNPSNENQ